MVALIADEGNIVQVIDAAEKVRYHAAAVLASNQVIALYQRACDAEHVAQDGVIASLTGPAERGDTATIQKHLDCLDGSTREVYALLNDTLLEIAARKHESNN